MSIEVSELLAQSLRALYLIGLPVVVVVFLASSVASILQSALAVREGSINYAIRLVAFILLAYLMMPSVSQTLITLAELAFK